ncbi:MAG: serine hydrolase [Acidobacteria bacterium]|nr:serine hydrolase [Acidobacteriota bacterium]MSO60818.1 serine hydrolase [Acidobacteriota bacterium]
MKLVIALVALSLASFPPAEQSTPLNALLTRAATEFPGIAAIWVKHLTTGETAGVREGELLNSASVIKIPVMVLAFQMAERGEIKLDERITIRKEDLRGGSGIFRYHDAGLQPTFREVLLQMIITSDNTATDLAIGRVGGVAGVNAWLKQSGYADGQRLVQTTGDLFAKYNALPPADDPSSRPEAASTFAEAPADKSARSRRSSSESARAEAERNARTNSDRTYWLGELTARSIGLMFEAIDRKTIASAASCDEMLRMLRAQQAGQRRLNHFISVPVAHKTGDFPPVLAHDVGIIYARSGPIVVSFLGNAITGIYGEAEDRIGRFAQQIVEHFDK